MKKLFDISWEISPEMTSYKNKKPIEVFENKNFADDRVRDSDLKLNMHTGTHLDAPAHFLEQGEYINNIDPELLLGECLVLDFSGITEKITRENLEEKVSIFERVQDKKNLRVLLKTKNSEQKNTDPFDFNFIYLEKSGAEFFRNYLKDKNFSAGLVGIDSLGIERAQPAHETHRILFENKYIVLEGLRLKDIPEGFYELICAPLLLKNREAAPARVFLREL